MCLFSAPPEPEGIRIVSTTCTRSSVRAILRWQIPVNGRVLNYTINITTPQESASFHIMNDFNPGESGMYVYTLVAGMVYTISIIPMNCRGSALTAGTIQTGITT